MKRRSFLKNSSAVAAGSLILNGIPVQGLAAKAFSPSFTCEEVKDRIFVMVNMFGANDTLNTVVPSNFYSQYAGYRADIKITGTTTSPLLTLDTANNVNPTQLHPIMTPFKELYLQGKLNVVHGVGYPNNNRSHFKSDDLWNTAGDTTAANFNYGSGWAGQLFDYRYPGLLGSTTPALPDPPCIELGATNGSILFQTANNNNSSVLLTYNNASNYYNTLISVGGPAPASYPATDFGLDLKYINDTQELANVYAARIQNVFNAGSNTSAVTYPDTFLANQLKTVARLIKGGSKSNMYTVHQYGYDTHVAQVDPANSSLGSHTNLLKELTEAVKAFQDDITALGFEDRVITTTHSEFGRTVDQNGGKGTDHGGVSTMFVIGKGVKPGITGTPINLGTAFIQDRVLTDLQYDYRQVWAAVLQDFMGHDVQPMTAARMNTYLPTKAPIIGLSHLVEPACYINQNNLLPITLAYLNAKLLSDGNASVEWQTSTEINCKEFEIEHSINSNNWDYIGTVAANGNSSTARDYTLIHSTPKPGVNYYRIVQKDFNGRTKLYGPVQLRVKDKAGFTVKNYPNPAVFDFYLTVTSEKKQRAAAQFYDMQGHLLLQKVINIEKGFNKYNYLTSEFKGYKGEMVIYLKTEFNQTQTLKQILQ